MTRAAVVNLGHGLAARVVSGAGDVVLRILWLHAKLRMLGRFMELVPALDPCKELICLDTELGYRLG